MKKISYVLVLFLIFGIVGVREVYGFERCIDTPKTGADDICGVGYNSPIFYSNSSQQQCYTCTPECITVTTFLNANGGSGVPSSVTCTNSEYACHASLPTPTKEGCTFDGWYSSNEGKNLYSYADCANNGETLVAQWKCSGPKPSDDNDDPIAVVPSPQTSGCFLCISQADNGKTKWQYVYANSKPGNNCIHVDLDESSCSNEEYPDPEPEPTVENHCYLCLSDGTFSFGTSAKNKQGNACSNYTIYSKVTSANKCNSSLMPSVTPTCYSTIKYDPNGGKFMDGSTAKRTQVVKKGEKIGEFKTNPVKKGYKFVCWTDSSGKCYTKFNEVMNECSDFTLTAKYEKYTKKYCCEDSTDIYDPSKGLCYKVLKTNQNSDPFNFTTYTYKANGRYCYGYYGDSSKPGIILSDGSGSTHYGKDNRTDGVYAGYSSDAWRESNSCKFKSACADVMSTGGKWYTYGSTCSITWRTILYKVSDSVACPAEPTPTPTPDPEPTPTPDPEPNPDTGDMFIYIAWAIGFGSLGYSIYWFKKYGKKVTDK